METLKADKARQVGAPPGRMLLPQVRAVTRELWPDTRVTTYLAELLLRPAVLNRPRRSGGWIWPLKDVGSPGVTIRIWRKREKVLVTGGWRSASCHVLQHPSQPCMTRCWPSRMYSQCPPSREPWLASRLCVADHYKESRVGGPSSSVMPARSQTTLVLLCCPQAMGGKKVVMPRERFLLGAGHIGVTELTVTLSPAGPGGARDEPWPSVQGPSCRAVRAVRGRGVLQAERSSPGASAGGERCKGRPRGRAQVIG